MIIPRRPMRAALSAALALFYVAMIAGGCGTLDWSSWAATPPFSTPPLPSPSPGQATSTAVSRSLRIWLPSRFDPDSTAAGALLKRRIDAFAADRPGLRVELRVKDEAALLSALALTKAVAPEALPDLVALGRPQLETAALKGLLQPFGAGPGPVEGADWFPYALEASRLQDTTYGLPFAGDALAILYHAPGPRSPTDWVSLRRLGRVAVPMREPEALFVLSLYQSQGGRIRDDQGRPALDEAVLARTLGFFADATIQMDTEQKVWQAYQAGSIETAVTWSSRYLKQPGLDTAAAPLSGFDDGPYSLGTAWCWALASPDPQRQALAAALAGELMNPGFLADFTGQTGYLPTRRAVLESWPAGNRREFAGQVIGSAHLAPPEDISLSLGPILVDAAGDVLRGQSAAQASRAAVERLK